MRRTAFGHLAKLVVAPMRCNNKNYRRYQKPGFIFMKKLLGDQKPEANRKKQYRHQVAMVFSIAMQQGIAAYYKGQPNHTPLKNAVVNNVDPKQRKAGHQQGEQGAVDCTGQ